MSLSASKYIAREDAVAAGHHAGDIYALAILIAFIVMGVNLPTMKMFLVGVTVILGLRYGLGMWMGARWDSVESQRHNMMREGSTWQEAYERLK